MSSPNTKPAPAPSPPSKPIEILQTPTSLFHAHLHPVLLLSLLYFRFQCLVDEPVGTLLELAPVVAVIQAVYCVLCLPSTGQTPPSSSKPGQKRKPAKQGQDVWSRIVPASLSLLLTLTLTTPLLTTLLILFGAPLTTHHAHTALLALHLALLTTPQLFYTHGLDRTTWFKILSLQVPVDEAYGMTLGACAGAWMGAVPIPLDWDREWQRWPVTVVTGLYLGAVVGKTAGAYLFAGWRIKLS